MTTTTYFELNIVEGTDIVNPLVVDNPNYEKIDEVLHDNAVSGTTLATELTNGTVHAITRENSECAVIRFIATSEWKAGDTVTVDGVPVTALLPSGETLPDGAYVINANVLCILTGTNLTVYTQGKKAINANEVKYSNTNVAEELDTINESLVNANNEIAEINSNLTVRYDAETDYIQALYNGEWINIMPASLQTYWMFKQGVGLQNNVTVRAMESSPGNNDYGTAAVTASSISQTNGTASQAVLGFSLDLSQFSGRGKKIHIELQANGGAFTNAGVCLQSSNDVYTQDGQTATNMAISNTSDRITIEYPIDSNVSSTYKYLAIRSYSRGFNVYNVWIA